MSDTANLLTLAAVWALIAAALVRLIPNWLARITAFALLVGIPFWELPYGYYNFERLCKEEARLRIYEAVASQDSVCVENLDSGLYEGLVRTGFTRIEVTGSSDDSKRDTASGKVFLTKRQEIKSKYCLQFTSNIELPWRVLRHDSLVALASDNHVIGRQSQFLWFGMWWQEKARPVLGRGGVCYDDPQRLTRFLRTGEI